MQFFTDLLQLAEGTSETEKECKIKALIWQLCSSAFTFD
jgi:hypothetical protein